MANTKNTPNSSNNLQGSAKTMAELLAKHKPKVFSRGDEVDARVLKIKGNYVSFDLSSKSEAVVEGREYENARDFIKTLKPGRIVRAVVVNPETDSGTVLVSLRHAGEESAWRVFEEALENNKTIDVTGKKLTRGGIIVDALGIQGFVPVSQLSHSVVNNQASLLNKQFKVTVVELDRSKSRVVCSEKAVTEKDKIEQAQAVIKELKPGEIFEGRVVGAVPSGAFVRIEKNGVVLDGFVHVSELSWKPVEDSNEAVKIGDSAKVIFLGQKSGKPSFSIKQANKEAWDNFKKTYAQDARVNGIIHKTAGTNFVVSFSDGMIGYLPTNKIPAGKSLKEGNSVNCFVESIDEKRQRVMLGLLLTAKPMGYK